MVNGREKSKNITCQNNVIRRFQRFGTPNETSTPVGNIIYHKQSDVSLINESAFTRTEIDCDYGVCRDFTVDSNAINRNCQDEERLIKLSHKNRRNSSSCEKIQGDCHNSHNSSLEDHVFHDTSYTRVAIQIYSSFNTLHKINGTTCFEDYSDYSDNEVNFHNKLFTYVNHQQRSQFRQNRRDWYLNRRTKVKVKMSWIQIILKTLLSIYTISYILLRNSIELSKKIFFRYLNVETPTSYVFSNVFIKIITFHVRDITTYSRIKKMTKLCFLSIYEFISSNLLVVIYGFSRLFKVIFLFICEITSFIKSFFGNIAEQTWFILKKNLSWRRINMEQISLQSLVHNLWQKFQQKNKDKEDDEFFTLSCCFMLLLPVFVLTPLLLLFILGLSPARTIPVHNTLRISHSQSVFLGAIDDDIPALHFIPPSAISLHVGHEFEDKSPVLFYLRESGDLINLKKKIFQMLVSLGYHVIVPINILNEDQISIAWSHINERTKSSVYLWGDHLDSRVLTAYAKDFCSQWIPPSGVILETKVKTQNHQHRSLEIWACNCTYVKNKERGNYQKYTHVKCPLNQNEISNEQLYRHIVSCIEAVNRDVI